MPALEGFSDRQNFYIWDYTGKLVSQGLLGGDTRSFDYSSHVDRPVNLIPWKKEEDPDPWEDLKIRSPV